MLPDFRFLFPGGVAVNTDLVTIYIRIEIEYTVIFRLGNFQEIQNGASNMKLTIFL